MHIESLVHNSLPIIVALGLGLSGCSIEEGGGGYRPNGDLENIREQFQELKQQYVTVEDLKIGEGGVAAYGRRVRANIQAQFADGTKMYEGSYSHELGFFNVALKVSPIESIQLGVWLGLNGMAVGGKRRITIAPHPALNDNPRQVIVEATLTDSGIPVLLRGLPIMLWGSSGYLFDHEVWCHTQSAPQYSATNPTWHIY